MIDVIMKELEHSEAPGTRTLKSLLKKPGQGKQRTHKNRVVINEKLNEFFAADYIILIKEECCADYEEECDCCCQETEMIRVGNCKECRAELSRHIASGIDSCYGIDSHGKIDIGDDIGTGKIIDTKESRFDDEDEEEEYEDEVDDYDEEAESSEEPDVRECSDKNSSYSQHQQQETLSPPEGYKDVCDDETQCEVFEDERLCPDGEVQNPVPPGEESQPQVKTVENDVVPTSDEALQTASDLHQHYLVETITMTTVTERRIVREISEEDSRCPSIDQPETTGFFESQGLSRSSQETKEEDTPTKPHEITKDTPNPTDHSLTFKMGNVSLVTNSLKPNSAVRQLFPDPRFISPPPVPAKSVCLSGEEGTDSDSSEAQKFLITTESLRLFNSVKRSKITSSRSESSESDSPSLRRTIERNALRRSLICKYDITSKKKNLKNKDLSLEERIRQLTCVDQDNDNTTDSASESQTSGYQNSPEYNRTSPSREERVERSMNNCPDQSPPLAHYHHHHQSAYRKITELFGQKKNDTMPDLGIGDKATAMNDFNKTNLSKINTDSRKQFLSSLAPLSCVASTGMDNRDDYYQISSKVKRDSIGYNSDSSYSLEDIEAALKGDERNSKKNAAPPDVTRGTPTGSGPDSDATADELLAFVEQDKTRTERLKRKYDTEDHPENSKNGDNNGAIDDEDDELNDYGFNTRPAVRGIKPQFQSTSEIVRQLRSRAVPVSLNNKSQLLVAPWPHHDRQNPEKSTVFTASEESTEDRDSTIKRINTMQRQIDDIYQTIAETAVSVQGKIDCSSYLDNTLPRTIPRVVHCRYNQKKEHYHDHRSGVEGAVPGDNRRPVSITSYPCNVIPVENKCYKTMYFVPYNGITDPTYQNIQRILPPHSSANYANHIERYPFHRNRSDPEQFAQPVPQLGQQPPRFYSQTPVSGIPPLHPQPSHNLHSNLPDDLRNRAPGISMQTVQLHHQHISQYATYDVQSVPGYTVMTPSWGDGYAYSGHIGKPASDVQTQTVSMTPMNTSIIITGFNTHVGNASSSSSTSSVLSSPTKIQGQRICTAERGVPEGAASAGANDLGTNVSGNLVDSLTGQPNNVPPPNTQNSLYYAMNV
ncbi:uncharacterized protein [Fopius arisanus]|uniref:Uncharacterized protein isoform X2 n=1 Tax=Fopius arisanus TaxID=64838 RepID=A0A9R1UA54_9HYME|nr:PREDICTED: uncharacterized protein LOC105273303 isoform X2 [Fopius arisanus]